MPTLTDRHRFKDVMMTLTIDGVTIEIQAWNATLVKESYGNPEGPCEFIPKKVILTLETDLKIGEIGWDWYAFEAELEEKKHFQKVSILKK